MCIPAGAELVSFGISRLDFARLGGLITFQNSTQSKKAICVLAFTSSPPKDCGPGRFLVSAACLQAPRGGSPQGGAARHAVPARRLRAPPAVLLGVGQGLPWPALH